MGTSWLAPLTNAKPSRLLADTAFAWFAKKRTKQLDQLNVAQVQEQTLLRYLQLAKQTRFGQDHHFARITSIAEYQERVPLRDYEDFWTTYWQMTYPKLDNITWPGKYPYYALSSGTTSGSTKYLPISKQMVKSNRQAAFTTMALFRNAHPAAKTFRGKFFFLGGSTELRQQKDGSFAGDLSGIATKELAGLARPYTFPPMELSLLSDWQVKLDRLAQTSQDERITAVSGVPSWMLTLFERVKQIRGKSKLIDVWPDLQVIVHGGTKFDAFRSTFEQEIGSDQVKYCEVYPCSEGFIATEDPRYHLLRIVPDHGIFFEFIPFEEFQAGKLTTEKPTRHTLANVETGVVYAIAVSNGSGVWSYLIGDTIMFESRNPPLIRFTGRTKNFLSAFGEHLIEEEVEKAIAVAAKACGVFTTDHHVGPVFPSQPNEPGHHLYLIEFRGGVPENLTKFIEILDAELRRMNEDYDAHRVGDLTMLQPRMIVVPEHGFDGWMKSRGKAGGQNKVPRMDNNGIITGELEKFFSGKF